MNLLHTFLCVNALLLVGCANDKEKAQDSFRPDAPNSETKVSTEIFDPTNATFSSAGPLRPNEKRNSNMSTSNSTPMLTQHEFIYDPTNGSTSLP